MKKSYLKPNKESLEEEKNSPAVSIQMKPLLS